MKHGAIVRVVAAVFVVNWIVVVAAVTLWLCSHHDDGGLPNLAAAVRIADASLYGLLALAGWP